MSRVLKRVKLLAPAIGTLVLAIGLVGYGTSAETIECDRASGTCEWRSGSLGMQRESTFRIADVREVRLVETRGKQRSASTQLVFANGTDRSFGGSRDRERAQATVDRAKAFFAYGSTVPAFRYASSGSRPMTILGVLAFALAIGLGVYGARKRIVETVPTKYNTPPAPLPEAVVAGTRWWHRYRRHLLLAGIALGGFAILFAVVVVSSRGQGMLELRCEQRCKLDGMECLPGGALDMAMDPGTYTIEVLAPTGPNAWVTRSFTIEQATTTTFVCR